LVPPCAGPYNANFKIVASGVTAVARGWDVWLKLAGAILTMPPPNLANYQYGGYFAGNAGGPSGLDVELRFAWLGGAAPVAKVFYWDSAGSAYLHALISVTVDLATNKLTFHLSRNDLGVSSNLSLSDYAPSSWNAATLATYTDAPMIYDSASAACP